jgi:DnaK suppressor protein
MVPPAHRDWASGNAGEKNAPAAASGTGGAVDVPPPRHVTWVVLRSAHKGSIPQSAAPSIRSQGPACWPPGVGETFGKDGDVSRRSKEPAMAITNPRFAPTVMASLVDLLLDRQACIGHSVAALRNEVADAFTRRDLSDMLDSQDPAADSDGAGVLLLLQQAEQRLWEVEQALQRFDGGTYGYCTTCGRGIRLQRLRALPTATSCFTCCAESPPERSEGQ